MLRALIAVGTSALLLAGCAGTPEATPSGPPNATPAPSASPTPSPPPSPPPSTQAPGSPAGIPAGWRLCSNTTRRYAIAYPARWYTNQTGEHDTCQVFDPTPFTIPPNSEYPRTALTAQHTDQDFATSLRSLVDPRFVTVVLREDTTVAGRRAVRLETVGTGEAPYRAKGSRWYGYLVDHSGRAIQVFTAGATYDKATVDAAIRTLALH